ncbi:hypothetical protein QTG54_016272 [Skeletonema marinoi]|uniref:Uncharacterized protein n=1 Tax=Skeletonema marinoi TaxID=267567 RepID=A0AAD8XSP5_9STRA|nr:hypothetical protein QTG54_016272 [Skeletonema marinoi]
MAKMGVPDSFGYPREEPVLDFIGCGWSNLKSFESPCLPSDDLIFGSGKRIEITVDSKDQIADVSIASKWKRRRRVLLKTNRLVTEVGEVSIP